MDCKPPPLQTDVPIPARAIVKFKAGKEMKAAVLKLTPLGDPAPNAPKWFAAIEIIRLATDHDWLHKATKEVAKYWRQKRERRQNPDSSPHFHNRKTMISRL